MFKRFRVLLNGENFKLLEGGMIQRMGFVTTRFVDASDIYDAEQKAIDRVFKEPITRICLNTPDDPPIVRAIKINQVRWFRSRFRRQAGYTFYVSDESADTN